MIDFGIAKATQARLTEKTLFTEFRQLIGTPEYMSPEQAEGDLDIDTRTDVYSLGVLLYELLTGTTPFDAQELRCKAYAEIQRIIREVEPPKPSTRLSQNIDTLAGVAAHRHTEPRKLSASVRGELDWIVMKCLEKDRARRYETANGLAMDVQRYLNDEPVPAGPPSARYRFRKFARRNKAALLTASVVVAALLAGTARRHLAGGRRDAREAGGARRRSRREDGEGDCLAREAETRAVLDFVQNKVFAAARPEGQEGGLGREVTLRKAVEAALPFVEASFTNQPLIEARLRMTLGTSFYYLGEAGIAAEQYEKARALYTQHRGPDHPDTLASMHNLANSYDALGRHADALKLREETLALRKAKLGPDHPDTLTSMNNLANSYDALGRHADALKLREETLALRKAKLGPDHPDTLLSMNNLANSYDALGRHADALKLHEETLALRKAKLGPDHPDTLASMNNLASSYARPRPARRGPQAPRRDAGAAESQARPRPPRHACEHEQPGQQLRTTSAGTPTPSSSAKRRWRCSKAKLGPDHPDTLTSMNNLADSYDALGRHADALKLREETLALRKAKLGPDHPDTLRA